MSEEAKEGDGGFNLNIGGDVHGDVAKEIDKSQHQTTNVQGDVHGGVTNTMAGSEYNQKCKEAVGDLMTDLSESFYPLDATETKSTSMDLISIEPEYHPLSLMASIEEVADQEEPPTEEQEASLRERLTVMLGKVSRVGKTALVTAGPIAVAAMKAAASIPYPWNIVCAGVDQAIKQCRESN